MPVLTIRSHSGQLFEWSPQHLRIKKTYQATNSASIDNNIHGDARSCVCSISSRTLVQSTTCLATHPGVTGVLYDLYGSQLWHNPRVAGKQLRHMHESVPLGRTSQGCYRCSYACRGREDWAASASTTALWRETRSALEWLRC